MLGYVARRFAWMAVLLLAVSAITFVIFHALPSTDPAALRAGRQASPEAIEQIRRQLGLGDPIHVQYARYMERVFLHFDFGFSFQNDAPVRGEILERLPATASLTAGAVMMWLAVGLTVGVISALRRRRLVDRLAMGATLVAISAPVYWLGLVSLYLFSADIGRLPLFPGAGSYRPLAEDPVAWAGSLVLPWLVLATAFAAFYARLLRGNLLEVLSEDYIRTARAKGLRERRVVLGHGMRAAVTPIVTVDAIQRADLPVIQGTVLFGTFFIVVANLLVDVAYAVLDPRVRYS
jgi:peptide/nickel transport system permease protein